MDHAIVPHWFLGYNILLELLFFAITLIVAVYALKVYQLSGHKQSKLFGITFLMISAAYLIQSVLNIVASYSTDICCDMQPISPMPAYSLAGIYVHILLYASGLVTLAYMTLKLKDLKAYFLFMVVALTALLVSSNPLFFFYVISTILLIYVSFYYLKNYLDTKKSNALVVFIAFLFLMFAKVHFIFSIDHGTYYVAGHLLEFVAYVLILVNLLMVIRRK